MKVTALIPNELVSEVKELTHGKNITDALISALTDWVSIQRIRKLNNEVKSRPLNFRKGFLATSIRETNRK